MVSNLGVTYHELVWKKNIMVNNHFGNNVF